MNKPNKPKKIYIYKCQRGADKRIQKKIEK